MPLIAWNDSLAINIAVIDQQHRMLVEHIKGSDKRYGGFLAARGVS